MRPAIENCCTPSDIHALQHGFHPITQRMNVIRDRLNAIARHLHISADAPSSCVITSRPSPAESMTCERT